LFNYKNTIKQVTFKKFIIKLTKSLLIPYFVFSVLAILISISTSLFQGDISSIKSVLNGAIYATITLRGVSTLWFLPTLFFAEIILYLLVNRNNAIKILSFVMPIFIGLIIPNLLFSLEPKLNNTIYKIISMPMVTIMKSLLAYWFVLIGYYSYPILKNLDAKIKLFLGLLLSISNLFLSFLNHDVDFNSLKLGTNPILCFVCGIIGSYGIISLFEFSENYLSFKLLNFCGKNSLILMITHLPLGLVAGVKFVITNIFITISLNYYIQCLLVLSIILLLEYFVILIISNKTPFLIGKTIPYKHNNKKTKNIILN
jgi:hypothetical protein